MKNVFRLLIAFSFVSVSQVSFSQCPDPSACNYDEATALDGSGDPSSCEWLSCTGGTHLYTAQSYSTDPAAWSNGYPHSDNPWYVSQQAPFSSTQAPSNSYQWGGQEICFSSWGGSYGGYAPSPDVSFCGVESLSGFSDPNGNPLPQEFDIYVSEKSLLVSGLIEGDIIVSHTENSGVGTALLIDQGKTTINGNLTFSVSGYFSPYYNNVLLSFEDSYGGASLEVNGNFDSGPAMFEFGQSSNLTLNGTSNIRRWMGSSEAIATWWDASVVNNGTLTYENDYVMDGYSNYYDFVIQGLHFVNNGVMNDAANPDDYMSWGGSLRIDNSAYNGFPVFTNNGILNTYRARISTAGAFKNYGTWNVNDLNDGLYESTLVSGYGGIPWVNDGTINILPTDEPTLIATNVINAGTINVGGVMWVGDGMNEGVTFENQGTVTISGPGLVLSNYNNGSDPSFINSGELNLAAEMYSNNYWSPSNGSLIDFPIVNSGEINVSTSNHNGHDLVNSGSINVLSEGAYDIAGNLDNSGWISLSEFGSISVSSFSNTGTIDLGWGSFSSSQLGQNYGTIDASSWYGSGFVSANYGAIYACGGFWDDPQPTVNPVEGENCPETNQEDEESTTTSGCPDPSACNYDEATALDGSGDPSSCEWLSCTGGTHLYTAQSYSTDPAAWSNGYPHSDNPWYVSQQAPFSSTQAPSNSYQWGGQEICFSSWGGSYGGYAPSPDVSFCGVESLSGFSDPNGNPLPQEFDIYVSEKSLLVSGLIEGDIIVSHTENSGVGTALLIDQGKTTINGNLTFSVSGYFSPYYNNVLLSFEDSYGGASLEVNGNFDSGPAMFEFGQSSNLTLNGTSNIRRWMGSSEAIATWWDASVVNNGTLTYENDYVMDGYSNYYDFVIQGLHFVNNGVMNDAANPDDYMSWGGSLRIDNSAYNGFPVFTNNGILNTYRARISTAGAFKNYGTWNVNDLNDGLYESTLVSGYGGIPWVNDGTINILPTDEPTLIATNVINAGTINVGGVMWVGDGMNEGVTFENQGTVTISGPGLVLSNYNNGSDPSFINSGELNLAAEMYSNNYWSPSNGSLIDFPIVNSGEINVSTSNHNGHDLVNSGSINVLSEGAYDIAGNLDNSGWISLSEFGSISVSSFSNTGTIDLGWGSFSSSQLGQNYGTIDASSWYGSGFVSANYGAIYACGGFWYDPQPTVNPVEGENCPELSQYGCTDSEACNYDANAFFNVDCQVTGDACDDGNPGTTDDVWTEDCLCVGVATVLGCTDSQACNYDELATGDDGSCDLTSCVGCGYPDAINYESSATQDDGSCLFEFEDPCPGDLNGDMEVDVHDLLDLFTYFGNICD